MTNAVTHINCYGWNFLPKTTTKLLKSLAYSVSGKYNGFAVHACRPPIIADKCQCLTAHSAKGMQFQYLGLAKYYKIGGKQLQLPYSHNAYQP